MNNLTKKLHVHFEEDEDGKIASKKTDATSGNGVVVAPKIKFNYSRETLYQLGRSKASKNVPKLIDEFNDVDEKRKEKIKCVLKNFSALKSLLESKCFIIFFSSKI